MSNIRALPGTKPPTGEPDQELIAHLRQLTAMAESGELRTFLGAGFTKEGLRVSIWCDRRNTDESVFELLGSITWLEHEYVRRHTA